MDGISFAAHIVSAALFASNMSELAPPVWPRDAVLIEYQSIQGGPTKNFTCNDAEWRDAYGYREHLSHEGTRGHISDNANNSYSALRYLRGDLGELLYAEFADVSDPLAWDFAPDHLNFFELYNMSAE